MKDLEISKELIKNVLTKETENLSDGFTFDIKDNYILFADDGELQFEVNLDTFARLCKEWARNKYDVTISSALYKNFAKTWDISNDIRYKANTEVETITKACNWILENMRK